MSLTIDATEQSRTARIERVWLDTDRPRAGRDANVKVLLRTFKGEELVKSVPIQIPGNATGIAAAAGRRREPPLVRGSPAIARRRAQPVAQLIRTFNKARRSNRLYIRLSASDDGAVVNGEPLTSLPPSVLAVLESDRNSGTYARCAARRAASGNCQSSSPSAARGSSPSRWTSHSREAAHAFSPRPPAPMLRGLLSRRFARLRLRRCARALVAPHRRRAGILAGGHASRLPARRGRQPLDRRTRTADARPRSPPRPRSRCAVRLDDAVPGPDGSLFLGTGNEGKVVRVDRDRQRQRVLRQRRDGGPRACARADGGLYVAHRRTAASTASTPRGRPRRSSIPTTNTSGRSPSIHKGMVFAATGDKGVVYRITPDGKGTVFFTHEDDACRVARVRFEGRMLAGSRRSGARVPRRRAGQRLPAARYAVSRSERAQTRRQGRSLRRGTERPPRAKRDGGTLTPGRPNRPPRAGANGVNRDHRDHHHRRSRDVRSRPRFSGQQRRSSRPDRARSIGCCPDGLWDQLWESRDDAPYDVAIEPDGALLVATGGKGKIFRLAGELMRPTLLTRVSAQQAVMLHRAGDARSSRRRIQGLLLAQSTARAERGTSTNRT